MNTAMTALLQAAKVTIDPSLRLYIPFNEGVGNVAKDYSQYGNNGVFTDVEWGILGGEFNGTSSYVNCGNDSSIDITDAITIEAWVKPVANTFYEITGNCIDSTSGYRFLILPDGSFRFDTNHNMWRESTFSSLGIIIAGEWAYLTVTRNGAVANVYKNGVDVTGISEDHIDPALSTVPLRVGVYSDLINGYFNGSIASVKIYNRVLSVLEILNDYESERGRYSV